MGIFSSKKITYVSSVAYNMSGNYTERMNYLKTLVLGGALGTGTSSYVGESITTGLVDGPYSGQRALLRWAKQKYKDGVPKAIIGGASTIASNVLTEYLNQVMPMPVVAQTGYAANAEAEEWARQYVYRTYPEEGPSLNWTYNVSDRTPGASKVTIDITGKGVVTIPMPGFDNSSLYCYTTYYEVTSEFTPPPPEPETFELTVGGSGVIWGFRKDQFGSLSKEPTSFVTTSEVTVNTSLDEISINLDGNVDYFKHYSLRIDEEEHIYKSHLYNSSTDKTTFIYQGEGIQPVLGEVISIGFIQVSQPVGETLEIQYGPFIDIYKYGSGNAVMEAAKPTTSELGGSFMPFAPIRIDNKFIDHSWYKDTYYDKVKDFYKRSSGGQNIDKLIDMVADNESLGDIDFAFMIYGVSLNTKSNYCRQYLYEFFMTLMDEQTFTSDDYDVWERAINLKTIYANEALKYPPNQYEGLQWMEKYNRVYQPPLRYNTISQRSNWLPDLYQIYFHWCFCRLDNLNANNYTNRKVGEVWFENLGPKSVTDIRLYVQRAGGGDWWYEREFETDVFSRFYIYKKHSNNHVTRIFVIGMQQENIIYNGVAEWITADEALKDSEESSLIVPMHMDTFRKLSLKAKNQVAVENTYMLFNCYTIVKKRWYQRGIFKVVFALVIAIVSVFLPPIGAIGGAGILGSNVALGVSMGFVGSTVTAAIAGAAVNAIAGMLVAQLVSGAVGSLFKGKLGAILGTLIMFFGGMVANSLIAGGSLNFNWSEMFSAKNLLKLTESVTKAANAWYAVDLSDIHAQMSSNTAKYEADMKHVQGKMEELLGTGGRGFLDPLMFTGEAEILNESSDSFLDRTLLTGSEIAELSMQMVNNFAEMNLQLPEAYI